MRKICFVVNPAAGSIKDPDALVARLNSVAGAEVKLTSRRGSAERAARSALKGGCELIVAAGGDGTLNEVVNGIGEKADGVQLGLIPLGTGNDFARSLELPTDLETCLEIILAGRTRAIDLVRVTSDKVRYFINVSAGGFSGAVSDKLTAEVKDTWGPLAYFRGAAAALSELRAYRTNLSFDNTESLSLDLYNIVVANGRYVAGGMPIAPDASIDDGLLDVVLLPETSAAQLAWLAPQILMGSHLSSDAVVFRRAARVCVNSKPGMWFNVDGEVVGNEPATFDVVPRALQFGVA
ncbi:MAG: diacylglycerol kinase family lipid kinase [Verrucomicrobiota bacterium]|nr:diacylglycerol kinase family lipid kinase [Verrucomicrobiota bacterium]